MAVISCEELPKGRTLTGAAQETDVMTRSFLVRTDNLNTSLIEISNAPGIAVRPPPGTVPATPDAHPDNPTLVAMEYSVKCVHDSGLLWQVDFKYFVAPVDLNDGFESPGNVEGFMKKPVWGGGSSVTTGPVTEDIAGNKITNSAGDPLEDAVKEHAEFRLSVTVYALTAAEWTGIAREYTNATNSDAWNGGAARTWKCQGCSAQLVTESVSGAKFELWEISWEFAYREQTWDLVLLDIGYNQLVDDEGQPTQGGTKKKAIVGQDKKPVSGPVGLNGFGIAVTPPAEPADRTFVVYKQKAFKPIWGEINP